MHFGTPSGTSLWIVLGLHLGAPLRTLWVPLGVFCDTTSSVRSLLSSIPRLESHLDAPCPTLVRFLVCLRVYVIFLGPSRCFRIKQDPAETTQWQNEKGSQSRITKGMFVEQTFQPPFAGAFGFSSSYFIPERSSERASEASE